jgi:hypothetical protein
VTHLTPVTHFGIWGGAFGTLGTCNPMKKIFFPMLFILSGCRHSSDNFNFFERNQAAKKEVAHGRIIKHLDTGTDGAGEAVIIHKGGGIAQMKVSIVLSNQEAEVLYLQSEEGKSVKMSLSGVLQGMMQIQGGYISSKGDKDTLMRIMEMCELILSSPEEMVDVEKFVKSS